MFKWYFDEKFMENPPLFWIGISIIILIIIITIFLVNKELRGK